MRFIEEDGDVYVERQLVIDRETIRAIASEVAERPIDDSELVAIASHLSDSENENYLFSDYMEKMLHDDVSDATEDVLRNDGTWRE